MSLSQPAGWRGALHVVLALLFVLGALGAAYIDRVLAGAMLIGVLTQVERAMQAMNGIFTGPEGRPIVIGIVGLALGALLFWQEWRRAAQAAPIFVPHGAVTLADASGAIPGMALVLGLSWWLGMRMFSRRSGTAATRYAKKGRPADGPRDPVNVNEASAEELAQIPFVGDSLAARMVARREEHGPFRGEADLIAVDGIGPRSVKRILPGLRFTDPEPADPDVLAAVPASGVEIGTPASARRTFVIVATGWAVSAASGQAIGLCIVFGVTAWFLAAAQGGRRALTVPARRTSFAVWLGALAVGSSLFGPVGAGWYSGFFIDDRFASARAAALTWPDLAQPWVVGQAVLFVLAWMTALLLAKRAVARPVQ